MTPLPPVSPSTTAEYDHLISILADPTNQVFEIDILPSSFPSESILHLDDPPSLGIPQALLLRLFLVAHSRFFSYIHSQAENGLWGEEFFTSALRATAVILLWDPNHVTAVNFRKRHVSGLLGNPRRTGTVSDEEERRYLRKEAVQCELAFLESLLTSPLAKHTKSSTLWSYRLWLLSSHLETLRPRVEDSKSEAKNTNSLDVIGQWKKELRIVMKAGDRHPRNYYAWNYARDLFHAVPRRSCNGDEETRPKWRGVLASERLKSVHHWCLQHPRDVSGWTFLAFLLHEGEGCGRAEEGDIRDNTGDEVQRVAWETKEFVRKYKWRGESVKWFLKAVEALHLGGPNNSSF